MTCKYCKFNNMTWEVEKGWDSCSLCHLFYVVMLLDPVEFPP